MPLTYIVILALIQGLTEFIPVSSSAHLIFPGQILGWPDQGLAFDVAVHLGTLLAVIIYYFADLVQIATYTIESVLRRKNGPVSRIGWYIIIATVPAAAAGYFLESYIETEVRSIKVIAWTTIIFGILLGFASMVNRRLCWRTIARSEGQRSDSLRYLTLQHALIIGCAQAVSLIPGTSRSGITLTAGLFVGLRPEAAARFSFLLAIPIILLSCIFEAYEYASSPQFGHADIFDMGIGTIISFLTAICVIHLFLKYISKSGLALFVIYRILLGATLLYIAS